MKIGTNDCFAPSSVETQRSAEIGGHAQQSCSARGDVVDTAQRHSREADCRKSSDGSSEGRHVTQLLKEARERDGVPSDSFSCSSSHPTPRSHDPPSAPESSTGTSSSVNGKIAQFLKDVTRLSHSISMRHHDNDDAATASSIAPVVDMPENLRKKRRHGGRLGIGERIDVFEPVTSLSHFTNNNDDEEESLQKLPPRRVLEDDDSSTEESAQIVTEETKQSCNDHGELDHEQNKRVSDSDMVPALSKPRRINGRLGIEQRIDVFEPNLRPGHRAIEDEYGPLDKNLKRLVDIEDEEESSFSNPGSSACSSTALRVLQRIRENEALQGPSLRPELSLSSEETNEMLKNHAFDTFSDFDDIVKNPFVALREAGDTEPPETSPANEKPNADVRRSAAILNYLREFSGVKVHGSFDSSSLTSGGMKLGPHRHRRSMSVDCCEHRSFANDDLENDFMHPFPHGANAKDRTLNATQASQLSETNSSSKPKAKQNTSKKRPRVKIKEANTQAAQSKAILSYLQEYSNIKGRASFDSLSTTIMSIKSSSTTFQTEAESSLVMDAVKEDSTCEMSVASEAERHSIYAAGSAESEGELLHELYRLDDSTSSAPDEGVEFESNYVKIPKTCYDASQEFCVEDASNHTHSFLRTAGGGISDADDDTGDNPATDRDDDETSETYPATTQSKFLKTNATNLTNDLPECCLDDAEHHSHIIVRRAVEDSHDVITTLAHVEKHVDNRKHVLEEKELPDIGHSKKLQEQPLRRAAKNTSCQMTPVRREVPPGTQNVLAPSSKILQSPTVCIDHQESHDCGARSTVIGDVLESAESINSVKILISRWDSDRDNHSQDLKASNDPTCTKVINAKHSLRAPKDNGQQGILLETKQVPMDWSSKNSSTARGNSDTDVSFIDPKICPPSFLPDHGQSTAGEDCRGQCKCVNTSPLPETSPFDRSHQHSNEVIEKTLTLGNISSPVGTEMKGKGLRDKHNVGHSNNGPSLGEVVSCAGMTIGSSHERFVSNINRQKIDNLRSKKREEERRHGYKQQKLSLYDELATDISVRRRNETADADRTLATYHAYRGTGEHADAKHAKIVMRQRRMLSNKVAEAASERHDYCNRQVKRAISEIHTAQNPDLEVGGMLTSCSVVSIPESAESDLVYPNPDRDMFSCPKTSQEGWECGTTAVSTEHQVAMVQLAPMAKCKSYKSTSDPKTFEYENRVPEFLEKDGARDDRRVCKSLSRLNLDVQALENKLSEGKQNLKRTNGAASSEPSYPFKKPTAERNETNNSKSSFLHGPMQILPNKCHAKGHDKKKEKDSGASIAFQSKLVLNETISCSTRDPESSSSPHNLLNDDDGMNGNENKDPTSLFEDQSPSTINSNTAANRKVEALASIAGGVTVWNVPLVRTLPLECQPSLCSDRQPLSPRDHPNSPVSIFAPTPKNRSVQIPNKSHQFTTRRESGQLKSTTPPWANIKLKTVKQNKTGVTQSHGLLQSSNAQRNVGIPDCRSNFIGVSTLNLTFKPTGCLASPIFSAPMHCSPKRTDHSGDFLSRRGDMVHIGMNNEVSLLPKHRAMSNDDSVDSVTSTAKSALLPTTGETPSACLQLYPGDLATKNCVVEDQSTVSVLNSPKAGSLTVARGKTALASNDEMINGLCSEGAKALESKAEATMLARRKTAEQKLESSANALIETVKHGRRENDPSTQHSVEYVLKHTNCSLLVSKALERAYGNAGGTNPQSSTFKPHMHEVAEFVMADVDCSCDRREETKSSSENANIPKVARTHSKLGDSSFPSSPEADDTVNILDIPKRRTQPTIYQSNLSNDLSMDANGCGSGPHCSTTEGEVCAVELSSASTIAVEALVGGADLNDVDCSCDRREETKSSSENANTPKVDRTHSKLGDSAFPSSPEADDTVNILDTPKRRTQPTIYQSNDLSMDANGCGSGPHCSTTEGDVCAVELSSASTIAVEALVGGADLNGPSGHSFSSFTQRLTSSTYDEGIDSGGACVEPAPVQRQSIHLHTGETKSFSTAERQSVASRRLMDNLKPYVVGTSPASHSLNLPERSNMGAVTSLKQHQTHQNVPKEGTMDECLSDDLKLCCSDLKSAHNYRSMDTFAERSKKNTLKAEVSELPLSCQSDRGQSKETGRTQQTRHKDYAVFQSTTIGTFESWRKGKHPFIDTVANKDRLLVQSPASTRCQESEWDHLATSQKGVSEGRSGRNDVQSGPTHACTPGESVQLFVAPVDRLVESSVEDENSQTIRNHSPFSCPSEKKICMDTKMIQHSKPKQNSAGAQLPTKHAFESSWTDEDQTNQDGETNDEFGRLSGNSICKNGELDGKTVTQDDNLECRVKYMTATIGGISPTQGKHSLVSCAFEIDSAVAKECPMVSFESSQRAEKLTKLFANEDGFPDRGKDNTICMERALHGMNGTLEDSMEGQSGQNDAKLGAPPHPESVSKVAVSPSKLTGKSIDGETNQTVRNHLACPSEEQKGPTFGTASTFEALTSSWTEESLSSPVVSNEEDVPHQEIVSVVETSACKSTGKLEDGETSQAVRKHLSYSSEYGHRKEVGNIQQTKHEGSAFASSTAFETLRSSSTEEHLSSHFASNQVDTAHHESGSRLTISADKSTGNSDDGDTSKALLKQLSYSSEIGCREEMASIQQTKQEGSAFATSTTFETLVSSSTEENLSSYVVSNQVNTAHQGSVSLLTISARQSTRSSKDGETSQGSREHLSYPFVDGSSRESAIIQETKPETKPESSAFATSITFDTLVSSFTEENLPSYEVSNKNEVYVQSSCTSQWGEIEVTEVDSKDVQSGRNEGVSLGAISIDKSTGIAADGETGQTLETPSLLSCPIEQQNCMGMTRILQTKEKEFVVAPSTTLDTVESSWTEARLPSDVVQSTDEFPYRYRECDGIGVAQIIQNQTRSFHNGIETIASDKDDTADPERVHSLESSGSTQCSSDHGKKSHYESKGEIGSLKDVMRENSSAAVDDEAAENSSQVENEAFAFTLQSKADICDSLGIDENPPMPIEPNFDCFPPEPESPDVSNQSDPHACIDDDFSIASDAAVREGTAPRLSKIYSADRNDDDFLLDVFHNATTSTLTEGDANVGGNRGENNRYVDQAGSFASFRPQDYEAHFRNSPSSNASSYESSGYSGDSFSSPLSLSGKIAPVNSSRRNPHANRPMMDPPILPVNPSGSSPVHLNHRNMKPLFAATESEDSSAAPGDQGWCSSMFCSPVVDFSDFQDRICGRRKA